MKPNKTLTLLAAVGSAQGSGTVVEDKVPYSFRTSGGSADIGNREYDTLVGGTLAWNQLCPLAASGFTYNSGITSLTFDSTNKTTTFKSVDALGTASFKQSIISGHRYLVSFDVTVISSNGFFLQKDSDTDYNWRFTQTGHYAKIFTPTSYWQIKNYSNTQDDTTLQYLMCIDLTLMFGSAIANYIYSLETANAGAGVAWFRKLFPAPYYAYQPGTLESSRASAHKMVGFNLFDADTKMVARGWTKQSDGSFYIASGSGNRNVLLWENQIGYSGNIYILCDVKYSASNKAGARFVFYYEDGTSESLSYGYHTDWYKVGILSGNKKVSAIGMTYSSQNVATWMRNICINLSWSGIRNGEYEPYTEHTYPLDDTLTLRGIPKLDGDNNLYFDGDTYEADGTVTRRYGIVDLGTLNWTYDAGSSMFYVGVSGRKQFFDGVCQKYTKVNASSPGDVPDKSWTSLIPTGYNIWVRDSAYNNADTFTTAMSGVYLVYELATPTTESADPFQSPQIVDDWGTEEYVDADYVAGNRDFAFPQGHDTRYVSADASVSKLALLFGNRREAEVLALLRLGGGA